jgi:hypothetical protein
MSEAHIKILGHYEWTPGVMILQYTGHYQQLIQLFALTCNFFELSCWPEETEILKDAEQKICSKGTLQRIHDPTIPGTLVCLVSELSPTIVDELLMKPFDEYGRIKWFGLSLGKALNSTSKKHTQKSIILELSHCGQEMHISKMSEEEFKVVQAIFAYSHEEEVALHISKSHDF